MFQPGGPTFSELTRQALSSTRRGYDLLAPRFDRTPFRTPDVIVDVLRDHLGRVEGDVLDLCCGTGAITAMARQITDGEVVGVDFSPGMLDVARKAVPGATFLERDARELDLEESFDLVLSSGAFGHFTVPQQPLLLANVHRALRPGGRFVFVTSTRPPFWNPTALAYRGFNLVMKVRNRLLRPRFIMYYLNFLLPEVQGRLEDAGFTVHVFPVVGGPFERAFIVEAHKA